jgi:hypothetical protein
MPTMGKETPAGRDETPGETVAASFFRRRPGLDGSREGSPIAPAVRRGLGPLVADEDRNNLLALALLTDVEFMRELIHRLNGSCHKNPGAGDLFSDISPRVEGVCATVYGVNTTWRGRGG